MNSSLQWDIKDYVTGVLWSPLEMTPISFTYRRHASDPSTNTHTHAWLCWSPMPQQLQSKDPCELWPWPWTWAAHGLSSSLSLRARWDHIKTWKPLVGEKGIQFSYCTIHFIPSCGIKFIPFWSVVCVYKSFKLICFRCCGNSVANWIPKCLSRFHTHDKEPEHLLVGVRTEAEEVVGAKWKRRSHQLSPESQNNATLMCQAKVQETSSEGNG